MKATFARKVAEADKVLTLLRETGHTLARMSYFQLAVGDRMTSLAWDRKMAISSELEERLRSLELDDTAIRDAKAPLLNVATIDLYFAFEHIAGKLRQEASNEAGRQMHALSATSHSDPDYSAKIDKLVEQRKLISDAGAMQFPALTDLPVKVDLEELTASKLLGVSLPEAEADLIETFRKKIVRMGNECWFTGSLTKETQAFLAENIHRDALFVEVMGRPPIKP